MRTSKKNSALFQKASKIGYILRKANGLLKSNPKNYNKTKEWKKVIAIACRCTDLPFLTLYISNVDGNLDIAAFAEKRLIVKYGKLEKIIKTPNPKKRKTPKRGLFYIEH